MELARSLEWDKYVYDADKRAMRDTVGWHASRHQKAGNRPEIDLRECT